jgi:hypothetical protein
MQNGENWFFLRKLKKKKKLPSPFSQAILAIWQRRESSATAIMAEGGGFKQQQELSSGQPVFMLPSPTVGQVTHYAHFQKTNKICC